MKIRRARSIEKAYERAPVERGMLAGFPASRDPSGKSFPDEETSKGTLSLHLARASQNRLCPDSAFVRSSRLIRDILRRWDPTPFPPFVVLPCRNFPPAGELLGSWLGQKSLKELRAASRGEKSFPRPVLESKG